jgi:tetratricopeptide (TPR) repeat protein
MIWISVAVIVLIVAVWQVSSYLSAAPARAQTVYDQAMANMTPGHYQDAVRLFSKAVDIYPQLSIAYLERGNAENVLGETEGALADYDKAIEIGNLAAAYTARGRIRVTRGDMKQAQGDFERSVGVEPNSDAYFQLGRVLEAAGDHVQAILNYDRALQIQPDSPDILLARGQSKAAKGDAEGALADRREAYEIENRTRK